MKPYGIEEAGSRDFPCKQFVPLASQSYNSSLRCLSFDEPDTESGSGTDFGAVGTVETGEKEIDVLDGTPPSIGETVTGPKLSSESSNWNVVGASDSTTMLNQRNTPSRPNSTGETVVPGEPGVRNEPDILSGSPEASVPSEAVFARGLEVAEAEGEMPQIGADVGWDTGAFTCSAEHRLSMCNLMSCRYQLVPYKASRSKRE